MDNVLLKRETQINIIWNGRWYLPKCHLIAAVNSSPSQTCSTLNFTFWPMLVISCSRNCITSCGISFLDPFAVKNQCGLFCLIKETYRRLYIYLLPLKWSRKGAILEATVIWNSAWVDMIFWRAKNWGFFHSLPLLWSTRLALRNWWKQTCPFSEWWNGKGMILVLEDKVNKLLFT